MTAITPEDKNAVDIITTETGHGQSDRLITQAFLGLNTSGPGSILPTVKDNQGITLFSRPRLNLTTSNILMSRKLHPYDTKVDSFKRAARVLLDPVSENGAPHNHMRGPDGAIVSGGHSPITKALQQEPDIPYTSNKIDPLSPWMNMLSNTLVSLSGWPDETFDVWVSDAGSYNSQYAILDAYPENYGAFDLTATFDNARGGIVFDILRLWTQTMSNCYVGYMNPWPDALWEFEIDYQTRIWRIVLGEDGRTITHIGSAVACIPKTNPLAAIFNYQRGRPYAEDISQVSIQFGCIGAVYDDPKLIDTFNDTTFIFNSELEKSFKLYFDNWQRSTPRSSTKFGAYVRLGPSEKHLFKVKTYPLLNSKANELEWWVEATEYEKVIGALDE